MQTEIEQIIEFITQNTKITSNDVAKMFSISRQAAHRKLVKLATAGEIVRVGNTRATSYRLPGHLNEASTGKVLKLSNVTINEQEVFESVFQQFPFLRALNEHLQSIFRYAFSEMLNNAIEHSQSDRIEVRANLESGVFAFEIRDFGVGVFRNVQKEFHLDSERDAATEILKGKITTAPQMHSGQGIFFTSKIADTFRLQSFEQELLVANTIPDIFIRTLESPIKGTRVVFSISTTTNKHLIDIFRAYESGDGEHDFNTTKIHVKLYQYGTVHVSRSQARRILAHLPERFTHVLMDFDQVPTIGQAFADEIFRVFKTAHPEISIETLNTNEAVQFMIDRV